MRLVSVIADNIQHAGQAAYLRGIIEQQKWYPAEKCKMQNSKGQRRSSRQLFPILHFEFFIPCSARQGLNAAKTLSEFVIQDSRKTE